MNSAADFCLLCCCGEALPLRGHFLHSMAVRVVYLMWVLLLKDAVLSLKAIRKDTLYLVSPTRSGFMNPGDG